MDALDVLDFGAKVGRMVDLVLKEDAGDFVADEVGRLDRVGFRVEVVVVERAGLDGEDEVASGGGVSLETGKGKGKREKEAYRAAKFSSPTTSPHILRA